MVDGFKVMYPFNDYDNTQNWCEFNKVDGDTYRAAGFICPLF